LQCLSASQSPEQQSPLPKQSLPAVLHLSFNAVQVLSGPQTPPQHSAPLVQALPSEVHVAVEQAPATQLTEQHSVAALHALPEGEQVLDADTQPVFASQTPEQHCAPPVQGSAIARQAAALPATALPAVPLALAPSDRPALPASAWAPVPPPPEEPFDELEPPHPIQTAVAAISSAPRILAGRVVCRVIRIFVLGA
jgi:hypothetical protein